MIKKYAVYKGLQQPLVFKGLKGKFIYWTVGFLLLGLVSAALTMALINMYAGLLVLVVVIAGGIFYTAAKQKNGLHSKSRNLKIQVHQAKFNNRIYAKEKRI